MFSILRRSSSQAVVTVPDNDGAVLGALDRVDQLLAWLSDDDDDDQIDDDLPGALARPLRTRSSKAPNMRASPAPYRWGTKVSASSSSRCTRSPPGRLRR